MLGVGQQAHASNDALILDQWDQLLHLIEDRLDDSQVNIQHDITEFLRRLFPEGSQPLSQLLRLAQHSERMSDDEIIAILSLDEVHGSDVPNMSTSTLSSTRYYVRSIKLSASELRRALEQYRTSYFDHNYCDSLMAQIQDMRPQDSVWLRYIGCTFASTPFDRHMDDVPRGASPTRYGNFCTVLHDTLERPLNTRVFEFTRLNLQGQQPRHPMDRDTVDGIEIFLIHLFGRHILLNSQPGGYYRSYVPNQGERACINTLDFQPATTVISSGGSQQQSNNAAAVERLLYQLRDQLQQRHTDDSRNAAAMMDPQHITFIANQATSGDTFQGNIIPMIMFGSKISLENHNLQRHFLDGSRSGMVTADMIKDILSIQQLSTIPIYDLWPVPSQHHLEDDDTTCFIETSANVMRTLQAHVIVTLGYETAAVTQSKFRDRHGLSPLEFNSVIGEPVLSNYDIDFNYEEAPFGAQPPTGWTITIAHLHPGAVSHGSADTVTLCLMYLSWVRTILLVGCLLQVLEEASPPPVGSRMFCEQVLQVLHDREGPTPLPHLLREARRAYQDLRQINASGRRQMSTIRGVPQRAYSSEESAALRQQQFERYGWTVGEPFSEERDRQCRRLEASNWAMFRRQHSYTHDITRWRLWFRGLRPNTNILQAALHDIMLDRTAPIGDLTPAEVAYLRTCPPPPPYQRGSTEWMHDPELVAWARQATMERMRSGLSSSESMRIANRNRTLNYWYHDKGVTTMFFMVKSKCDGHGRVRFRVVLDDGTMYAAPDGIYIGAKFKGTVYIDYDPEIYEHGLLVKDAEGVPLPSMENYHKITDVWLRTHTPPYFKVFQRTVEHIGGTVRQELTSDEEFSFDRLVPYFLVDHFSQQGKVISTANQSTTHPTVAELLTSTLEKHGAPLEKVAWQEMISKGNYKHFKDRVDKVHKTPRVDHNKRLWLIPKYDGAIPQEKQQAQSSSTRLHSREDPPPLELEKQKKKQKEKQKEKQKGKQPQQKQPQPAPQQAESSKMAQARSSSQGQAQSSSQGQQAGTPKQAQKNRPRQQPPPLHIQKQPQKKPQVQSSQQAQAQASSPQPPQGQASSSQQQSFDESIPTFTTRKRGEYTINDHNPFLYWWQVHKERYPVGAVLDLDYNDATSGFWEEFNVAVDKWGADHQSIQPYLRSLVAKKPQSLNAVFRKHGWNVTPVKRGKTVAKGKFIAVPTRQLPQDIFIATTIPDYETQH